MGGKKKFVFGVGTNDASEDILKEGGWYKCPYYIKWHSMIRRCYSSVYQKDKPTYIGCSVSPDWLLFSNFKSWMEKQDWEGKHLDKDILVKGNKLYSEETCIFVDSRLNSMLNFNRRSDGGYLAGVSWKVSNNKFQALIGKTYLGLFIDEKEAHRVYCIAKNSEIRKFAEKKENISISAAILQHLYSDEYLNNLVGVVNE